MQNTYLTEKKNILKPKNLLLRIKIIYVKRPILMYVTNVNTKNHIFFHTNIFQNCIPLPVYVSMCVCVCVCVKDTC